jgi:hypothetical protein
MAPVLFNRQAFIILQAVAGEINLQKALQGKDLGFTLNYGSEQFTNRKETIMIMKRFALVSTTLALALLMLSGTAPSATLLLENSPGGVVSLKNVATKGDGEVTGEVVNNSQQTIRDVVLEIRYSWRWKNEFHPGTDDPGRAVYHTINQGIAPGQSARFDYKPTPPLPVRQDGYFDTGAWVAGFEQIYR